MTKLTRYVLTAAAIIAVSGGIAFSAHPAEIDSDYKFCIQQLNSESYCRKKYPAHPAEIDSDYEACTRFGISGYCRKEHPAKDAPVAAPNAHRAEIKGGPDALQSHASTAQSNALRCAEQVRGDLDALGACGKPLVEYLFSQGHTLGDSESYASYVTATGNARGFGVPARPYVPDTYIINGVNKTYGDRGPECLYH
jgi:hypothetical protein